MWGGGLGEGGLGTIGGQEKCSVSSMFSCCCGLAMVAAVAVRCCAGDRLLWGAGVDAPGCLRSRAVGASCPTPHVSRVKGERRQAHLYSRSSYSSHCVFRYS